MIGKTERPRLNSGSHPSSLIAFSPTESEHEGFPRQADDSTMEVDPNSGPGSEDLMTVGQNVEVVSTTDQQQPQPMMMAGAGNHGNPPTTSSHATMYATISPADIKVQGAEALLHEVENGREEKSRTESKFLEDTSDIDEVIHLDISKIPVKKLRVVVPRLRVACYLREEEICGKKKMKNMWNHKPSDWPSQVPFRDPNNKGTDGHKAGKEELVAMYEYLKGMYLKMPRDDVMLPPHEPKHTPSHAAMDVSMPLASPHAPIPVIPKEEPSPGTMIDTHRGGMHIKQECLSPQPVVQQQQQQLPQHQPRAPAPTHVMIPPPQEFPAQTMPTRQEVNRTLGQENRSHFQQPGTPLFDLHERINNKLETVQIMVQNDQEALLKLQEVHQDVVEHLFTNANRMEVCCAFLDAGHQFETLLDVVLAFGKDTALDVLRQGCQELLDKFAPQRDAGTQSSPIMHTQVYTAQVATKPSLAPANGNHYIPSVAGMIARQQQQQRPVVMDTSNMKREAPSPNTVAGMFSQLGVNMRRDDISLDHLSTIVETREESKMVQDKEEEDKLLGGEKDIFDLLMNAGDENVALGGTAKVVAEPITKSEHQLLSEFIKMPAYDGTGEEVPPSDALLLNSVLEMEKEYGSPEPQVEKDFAALMEEAGVTPSLTLNTTLGPCSPPAPAPANNGTFTATPLAQTAALVNTDNDQALNNFLANMDTQMTIASGSQLTTTAISAPAALPASFNTPATTTTNNTQPASTIRNFGLVPSYQTFTTENARMQGTPLNNIGTSDTAIPTTVVDFTDLDNDPVAAKRMRMAGKGVKRLSHKGVRKGKV